MISLLVFFFGFFFLFGMALYFQLDMLNNNKIYVEVYDEEKVRFTEEDYSFRIKFEN